VSRRHLADVEGILIAALPSAANSATRRFPPIRLPEALSVHLREARRARANLDRSPPGDPPLGGISRAMVSTQPGSNVALWAAPQGTFLGVQDLSKARVRGKRDLARLVGRTFASSRRDSQNSLMAVIVACIVEDPPAPRILRRAGFRTQGNHGHADHQDDRSGPGDGAPFRDLTSVARMLSLGAITRSVQSRTRMEGSMNAGVAARVLG
jgi:hypothetical protein